MQRYTYSVQNMCTAIVKVEYERNPNYFKTNDEYKKKDLKEIDVYNEEELHHFLFEIIVHKDYERFINLVNYNADVYSYVVSNYIRVGKQAIKGDSHQYRNDPNYFECVQDTKQYFQQKMIEEIGNFNLSRKERVLR